MKSYSQSRLGAAISVSSSSTTSSKQHFQKDWADKVKGDQISKALNSDLVKPGSTLFAQFNERQRPLNQNKIPRLSSHSSSRTANQTTTNTILNKTSNQSSLNSANPHLSPRESAVSQSFVRSNTQDAQRRRSLKQNMLNHTDMPDLGKASSLSSASQKHSHQLQSPSEKIIPRSRQLKKVMGGEGSSTDRLFQQIISQHSMRHEEQNKENINEEAISKLPSAIHKNSASNPPSLKEDSISLQSNASSYTYKNNIEKHLKEVNKQKELLLKLQREKEELEKQLQSNEKVIQNRMVKLHQERKVIEERIVNATVTIQRYARGFICRLRYHRLLEEAHVNEKAKLNDMLRDLQANIKNCCTQVEDSLESAAKKIQCAARKMLHRKRFRLSLYKLMLTKNIIENKIHKERMAMLFAFEQLIINTEDEEEEYYDEAYGEEGEEGDDSYFHENLMQLYNPLAMQRIPNEHDYLSNPSDIIDEEEFEESQIDEEETKQPSPKKQAGKVLTKVTPSDLLQFAGKGAHSKGQEPFELDMDYDMFNNGRTTTETDSVSCNIIAVRNTNPKPATSTALVCRVDQGTQYFPPRARKTSNNKLLALPPAEPAPKQVPSRPVDMERLEALSKPRVLPASEPEPIKKKKATKPPVAPGTKKQKKVNKVSRPQTNSSDVSSIDGDLQLKKKRSRRNSKALSVHQRLLQHRESRTSVQKETPPQVMQPKPKSQVQNEIKRRIVPKAIKADPSKLDYEPDHGNINLDDYQIMNICSDNIPVKGWSSSLSDEYPLQLRAQPALAHNNKAVPEQVSLPKALPRVQAQQPDTEIQLLPKTMPVPPERANIPKPMPYKFAPLSKAQLPQDMDPQIRQKEHRQFWRGFMLLDEIIKKPPQ